MKRRILSLMTLSVLIAATFSIAAFKGSGVPKSLPNSGQTRPKTLKEIAMERDVEVEGPSGCDLVDMRLADLSTSSNAIVYGRITDSDAFFDESSPSESGDYITTEYTVEVFRVLKDRTLETIPPPGKAAPAPLMTPLKIARNGGVLSVNRHRASVKVKGYESIVPGKQYVFFLNWSPNYHAYKLTYCIFGALMVNDDLSLKSLGTSKEFQSQLRDMSLESLFKQLQ